MDDKEWKHDKFDAASDEDNHQANSPARFEKLLQVLFRGRYCLAAILSISGHDLQLMDINIQAAVRIIRQNW